MPKRTPSPKMASHIDVCGANTATYFDSSGGAPSSFQPSTRSVVCVNQCINRARRCSTADIFFISVVLPEWAASFKLWTPSLCGKMG